MRIAFFSECYTPVTNGVVTSLVTLGRTLREWGHTVYIFAPGPPQPDDGPDVFRLPELPFPRHPYHFARPFPRLNFDFAALRVEMIHCHHPFTVGNLGADLAAKHGLPMVYTAHSLYDNMVAVAKSPLVRTMGQPAIRSVIKWFCSKANYVITPSRHTQDALTADGVRSRFVIVPSGIPPLQMQPGGRERVREQLNLAPETPLLLYVGRLAPEKRLDLLLRAVSLLAKRDWPCPATDFRLALVGDGQCREDLEEQAARLQITDRVIFLGSQPHEQIGDWYAAGDIFTLPSPAETQGLVLVEAMSAGLPCVAANEGGAREVVLQGETGIRVPLAADTLAHAIQTLLNDAELRQILGERGREKAQMYSPDAMTRAVLEVYEMAKSTPRLPKSSKRQDRKSKSRRNEFFR